MAASSSSSPLSCVVGRLIAPFLLMLALMLYPNIATAADITVDGEICTLPDAITAANLDIATGGCSAGEDADTLLLTAPIYSLATGPFTNTIPGGSYQTIGGFEGMSATPSITSTIVISGNNDGAIVERSGSDSYRLFHVGGTGNLTIHNVTIRYGKATLTLITYPYEVVWGSGGGIYNRGKLTLTDSRLISNSAPDDGGGLYNYDSGTVHLSNVTFVTNVAGGEGGGFANRGTANLTNAIFASNTANQGGGFSNYWPLGDFISDESTKGQATFSNSEFFSNNAQSGGALYAHGMFGGRAVRTELTNVNFIANVASRGGGGISNGENSTIIINNSNLIANKAVFGGAGSNNGAFSSATMTINNSHIFSNAAETGGAIYNSNITPNGQSGILTITNSEIRANRATYMGGAIMQDNGWTHIVNSLIIDNWAGHTGSAVVHTDWREYRSSSGMTIEQSCIVNNSDTAITNLGDEPIKAGNNWWGNIDGPTGAGPGGGDSVGSNVIYEPFLTSPILNCALRDDRTLYLPQVEP